jgi:8-oxo-dGTP diphosphatase
VAAAVVREDGWVLVIQRRDNGKWEPPGGVLELDETVEDGLRREVLEETGLHIEVEALTGVYKNLTRGIVALVFRCRPKAGVATESPEAAQVRWFHPTEVGEQLDPAYAVRLLDAFDERPAPAVRAHDGVDLIG